MKKIKRRRKEEEQKEANILDSSLCTSEIEYSHLYSFLLVAAAVIAYKHFCHQLTRFISFLLLLLQFFSLLFFLFLDLFKIANLFYKHIAYNTLGLTITYIVPSFFISLLHFVSLIYSAL